MKIGILIRFYYYKKILNEINQGRIFPSHQLWGYDYLQKRNSMIEVNYEDFPHNNGILGKLFSSNIAQQNCMRKKVDIDILYVPFMFDCYWLAFLKIIKLYKKPIVAIAQDTWDTRFAKKPLTKAITMWHRFLAKKGIDRLLFISPNVLLRTNNYFNNDRTFSLKHWGVDLSYFDNYILKQTKKSNCEFAYLTGGSNRDFELMFNVVQKMENIDFVFQTSRKGISKILNRSQPTNLHIDTNCKDDVDLLNGYYNSFCVLVPLAEDTGSMTGITVVLEAMAMCKPVISTCSPYYPFDIEKEGIGITVDYGDKSGWINAIQFLYNNPIKAQEMGRRGRLLLEKSFNYELFCKELETHINDLRI